MHESGCMCVFMYKYMSACMHIYSMHIDTYECRHTSVYISTYVFMDVYKYIAIHA